MLAGAFARGRARDGGAFAAASVDSGVEAHTPPARKPLAATIAVPGDLLPRQAGVAVATVVAVSATFAVAIAAVAVGVAAAGCVAQLSSSLGGQVRRQLCIAGRQGDCRRRRCADYGCTVRRQVGTGVGSVIAASASTIADHVDEAAKADARRRPIAGATVAGVSC